MSLDYKSLIDLLRDARSKKGKISITKKILKTLNKVNLALPVFNPNCEHQAAIYGVADDVYTNELLKQHGPIGLERGLRAKVVSANGNCLFNAASLALIGDESLATELRVRTVVELTANVDWYMQEYAAEVLWWASYDKAIHECAIDGGDASMVWAICGLASVIQRPVKSVYPTINGSDDLFIKLLNRILRPRRALDDRLEPIFVTWTRSKPHENGMGWECNHFSPLIRSKDDDDVVGEMEVDEIGLEDGGDLEVAVFQATDQSTIPSLCLSDIDMSDDLQSTRIQPVMTVPEPIAPVAAPRAPVPAPRAPVPAPRALHPVPAPRTLSPVSAESPHGCSEADMGPNVDSTGRCLRLNLQGHTYVRNRASAKKQYWRCQKFNMNCSATVITTLLSNSGSPPRVQQQPTAHNHSVSLPPSTSTSTTTVSLPRQQPLPPSMSTSTTAVPLPCQQSTTTVPLPCQQSTTTVPLLVEAYKGGKRLLVDGYTYIRNRSSTVLLTDKKSDTYYRVINLLRDAISALGNIFNPEIIMSDFESGFIDAIRKQFPNARHSGCHFHFTQSLWRKVQEAGLVELYHVDKNISTAVQSCMALVFIPHVDVVSECDHIFSSLSPVNRLILNAFELYFRSTWLNGTFTIKMWNKYGMDHLHRTNNAVESWHAGLSRRLPSNPNIYVFVNELKRRQSLAQQIVLRADNGEDPPHRKRKYVQLEKRLAKMHMLHMNGQITSRDLLGRAAFAARKFS